MPDKFFRFFVSSTYKDLIKQRETTMQVLLRTNCLPAGMEFFPASNNETIWKIITDTIDTCDYYLLIVDNRYGTIGYDGKSYTEMEYRYAVEKNMPRLVFLRSIEESLTDESSIDNENMKKFRHYLHEDQSAYKEYWKDAVEFASKLSQGITRIIANEPRAGWIRGVIENQSENETKNGVSNTKKETEENAQFFCEYIDIAYHASYPKGFTSPDSNDYLMSMKWGEIFILFAKSSIISAQENLLFDLLQSICKNKCQNDEYYQLGKRFNANDPMVAIDEKIKNYIRSRFVLEGIFDVDKDLNWTLSEKGKILFKKFYQ